MLVPFSSLPDHARVWIYPSSRPFTLEEKQAISEKLSQFLNQWATHGTPLKTGFDLPYDHFIVIGLDEEVQGASGCSIDASVHLIQQLEAQFDLVLLDKMNVCYREKNTIHYTPLKEFRKLAKTPKVSLETIVFNNLVVDKSEYNSLWEVPAFDSWHARFIK
ncbi:MAG: ABC transporter ATPase [Flavobacteriaceae bacterium]